MIKYCEWKETWEGSWDSKCCGSFEFYDGGPNENMFKYCPFCGKLIRAIKYEEEVISDD